MREATMSHLSDKLDEMRAEGQGLTLRQREAVEAAAELDVNEAFLKGQGNEDLIEKSTPKAEAASFKTKRIWP